MKEIAVVLRNADQTEGRGPMVLDNVFEDMVAARHYVQQQPGIFGSKQRKDLGLSKPGCERWNGYEIRAMKLHGMVDVKEVRKEEARRVGLAKLTEAEREALGL